MFNNAYYIPDFREATRYFWRWRNSFGVSNITSFLMEIYYYSFSDGYICKRNWSKYCCFRDYQRYESCLTSAIDFYDAERTYYFLNLYVIIFFDVLLYFNGECWNLDSKTSSWKKYFLSYCFEWKIMLHWYICNIDETFTLSSLCYTTKCTRTWENVQLGSKTISCSDTIHICEIRKYNQHFEVQNVFESVFNPIHYLAQFYLLSISSHICFESSNDNWIYIIFGFGLCVFW
jgi:hypothetical protein